MYGKLGKVVGNIAKTAISKIINAGNFIFCKIKGYVFGLDIKMAKCIFGNLGVIRKFVTKTSNKVLLLPCQFIAFFEKLFYSVQGIKSGNTF